MHLFIQLKKLLNGTKAVSSPVLIAIFVTYMVAVENQSFWSSLLSVIDLSDPGMFLFLFACFSFIFTACFIFFSILGVGPLLKPLIALVLMIASASAFYMDNYGIVFNMDMVQNIVETNIHEATELINLDIILYMLIYGGLPILLLFRLRVNRQTFTPESLSRLGAMVIVLSISSIAVYTSYKDFTFVFRENREVSYFINPVFPLRAMYRFAKSKSHSANKEFSYVFNDAHKIKTGETDDSEKAKNILIIVVGETARDQQFHIDGYKRNTTPELEKRDVVHFSNTWSCGTATAISLPCMFSDMKRENFDNSEVRHRHNLMDALDIAGINTLWRENNPGCKGICDRIKTDNYKDIYMKDFCNEDGCFDEALLNHLDEYLRYLQDDSVIVLHTQGSHGPAYYRRYPENFKKFLPECRRSAVQKCTDEEIVNAYDNTILYTDYFLSKVIDLLKADPDTGNTAMIYISDHGESLGENGVYLHGLPYMLADDYQKHVPMIMWLSAGFSRSKQLDLSCLNKKSSDRYSQDNFLHSVLGIMDVQANLYNSKLDLFSSCRTHVKKSGMTLVRNKHDDHT